MLWVTISHVGILLCEVCFVWRQLTNTDCLIRYECAIVIVFVHCLQPTTVALARAAPVLHHPMGYRHASGFLCSCLFVPLLFVDVCWSYELAIIQVPHAMGAFTRQRRT